MFPPGVGLFSPEFNESVLDDVLGVSPNRQPLPRVKQQTGREFFKADPPVFIGVAVGHNHNGFAVR
jgi:hypothetical protein